MQVHPETRKSISLLVLLMPSIRLMSYSGLFIHRIANDFYTLKVLMSCLHLILITFHYCCIIINTVMSANDVAELTSNMITLLFFTHGITKFIYLGLHHRKFIRTLKLWDERNVHPLFLASAEYCHQMAARKIRKLLILVTIATGLCATGWIAITFFGESTKTVLLLESNSTISIDIPRLPIYSYYPWNAEHHILYILTFIYQCYYIIFSMIHGNMFDVLLSSWLIFSCEQLQYLKKNLKQLIQLSVSMDSHYASKSSSLLLANSINSKRNYDDDKHKVDMFDKNLSYIADWALLKRRTPIVLDNLASYPKDLPTEQEEMTLLSTIKSWVEHHKQIVKLVKAIGETYGVALLLHMLTSTVQLTLLAYQATKITDIDVFALSVIGYLIYSLAQIFNFCIFGNRLIEESSSVMEAVYSCQWYEGSEQAKTFVQIVCQQCQKALSISGAKFFTISLDLFASVLGAMVTYFMVLIQLK